MYKRQEVEGHTGTLVDLAGIAHLVIEGVAPSEDFFRAAEPLFSAIEGLDAYGVISLDRTSHRMTPLVKVVDTGTLIWEGSCGSGTIACAVAESTGLADGLFEQDYFQPAGVVRASVERRGGDVSREGVQRDLLPLIEGTAVSTKHGMVKTDHILFICSGAFHLSKPSDLLPELQGRLPIRVCLLYTSDAADEL